MLLTVAICTWNRSALLRPTLERMTELRVPAGIEWELLVVDNNCTDETPSVVSAMADRLPLRTLHEPKPGLSNARNRAVAEARGSYVIWTDDDVLVDTEWLASYAGAFRARPDAAVFGGPIDPWFDGEPPPWLQAAFPDIAGAFAARDLGDAEVALRAPDRLPFGANMAFRIDVQRQHAYDPELGRRGAAMIGGEETQVMARILIEGHHGYWVPGARVRHFIPKARQSTRYLRRYFQGYGISVARIGAVPRAPTLLGRPRWAWRQAVEHEVRYYVARATGRPSREWVAHLRDAATARGMLRGFRSAP